MPAWPGIFALADEAQHTVCKSMQEAETLGDEGQLRLLVMLCRRALRHH